MTITNEVAYRWGMLRRFVETTEEICLKTVTVDSYAVPLAAGQRRNDIEPARPVGR
jgi:hypothetical protein